MKTRPTFIIEFQTKKNMKLITQQISNHDIFTDVERTLNIERFVLDSNAEVMELHYSITYIKNGEDVSSQFNPHNPIWIVDNNHRMKVRDENFQPIPNPNYEPNNDPIAPNVEEQWLLAPAFDYVSNMIIEGAIPLKNIIQLYIAEEDADGRFDALIYS